LLVHGVPRHQHDPRPRSRNAFGQIDVQGVRCVPQSGVTHGEVRLHGADGPPRPSTKPHDVRTWSAEVESQPRRRTPPGVRAMPHMRTIIQSLTQKKTPKINRFCVLMKKRTRRGRFYVSTLATRKKGVVRGHTLFLLLHTRIHRLDTSPTFFAVCCIMIIRCAHQNNSPATHP
jgi:hypothetical protein